MRASIALAGSIAQKPFHGGHAWALLQWALGFRRLGYDVLWIDRLDPGAAVDDDGAPALPEGSANLRILGDWMRRFGLGRDWCLLAPNGGGPARSIGGIGRDEARERVERSELLLNVMGFLDDEELLAAARRRVFLDIDPGFGQIWCELGLADLFAGHDDFVTVGHNVGRAGCTIPDCGRRWIATRPPVVLDLWPQQPARNGDGAFRSVISWRGRYGPLDYRGRTYGLRVHEFRKFVDLPRRTGERFELALDIDPADAADRDRLVEGGWELADPRAVAGDPWSYRDFVAGAMAELQVAKQIYVETKSGWFSDRSACFLACGRPVVAEDTGLAGDLPLGEGLLAYRTLEEAARAVEEVASDLPRHSQAARRIAEERFASDRVLGTLLGELGAGPP